MKKGIIATTLAVMICVIFTAAYAFAAPSKTQKGVKKEATTTEKQKEATTAAKPKAETKESEVSNIEETEISTEEESDDIENTEEVSDDQEETDDSEPEEDLDNDEIDDEQMDRCDHVWSEKSVAYDPEEGYVWVQDCEKCSLVKQTQATEEEYDAAQQEELEE